MYVDDRSDTWRSADEQGVYIADINHMPVGCGSVRRCENVWWFGANG